MQESSAIASMRVSPKLLKKRKKLSSCYDRKHLEISTNLTESTASERLCVNVVLNASMKDHLAEIQAKMDKMNRKIHSSSAPARDAFGRISTRKRSSSHISACEFGSQGLKEDSIEYF
jgi:hypothetical protein